MNKVKLNPSTLSLYNQRLTYRILFELHKLDRFLPRSDGWDDDDLASALGIPLEYEENSEIRNDLKKALKARLQTAFHQTEADSDWAAAEQNLSKIAQRLKFGSIEHEILKLAFYLNAEPIIHRVLHYLGRNLSLRQCMVLVAQMLQVPIHSVREAWQKNQKLFCYGLLERSRYSNQDLEDCLEWGETCTLDSLFSADFDTQVLFHSCVQPTPPTTLSQKDFAHIDAMRQRMIRYLNHAYETQQKGVNILLYGAPGTGKTEFAAHLAESLAVDCYTLRYSDEDNDLQGGKKRLQNCTLAQALMTQQRAMIVFDEIEDVFSGSFFGRSVAQEHKAWVNQFLENNAVPMIWISNHVDCMDDAFLRRFDIVLHMPDLPLTQKTELIQQLANHQLTPVQATSLAKQSGLAPAVLARGFKVAASLDDDQNTFINHAVSLFNETLKAQGKRKIHLPEATQNAAYSLDWIACENDIHRISQGLITRKRGRICCYGPAGTGKTAWANWLGEQAGLPVLLKQGSDLLGKYVGETEQNIAAAFEQAKQQEMLLIIDEADSFLFTRDGAEKSWERSMVNEMLTQIERFDGMLVVSTNLMHDLDAAVLRRFDLKLKFDFLNAEQVIGLANIQTASMGLPNIQAQEAKRLQQIHNLTPGDFATVFRRHQFAPFDSVREWVAALEEESALKPSAARHTIGFYSSI